MKFETVIPWKKIEDQLPKIESESNPYFNEKDLWDKWNGFIFSEVILCTDGEDIIYGRYIFNPYHKNKSYVPGNDIATFINYESGYYIDDVYFWCNIDEFKLPQPPKIKNHKNDEKKYTLSQLRQAWGAGRFAQKNENIIPNDENKL